jgi:hypothetical protein
MMRSTVVFLLLMSAAWATTPSFLLGINYSEWGPYLAIGNTQQIAADGSGALYVLSQCTQSETGNGPSCLAVCRAGLPSGRCWSGRFQF